MPGKKERASLRWIKKKASGAREKLKRENQKLAKRMKFRGKGKANQNYKKFCRRQLRVSEDDALELSCQEKLKKIHLWKKEKFKQETEKRTIASNLVSLAKSGSYHKIQFKKIESKFLVPLLLERKWGPGKQLVTKKKEIEQKEEEEEKEKDLANGIISFSWSFGDKKRHRNAFIFGWNRWFGPTIPTQQAIDKVIAVLPHKCSCVSLKSGVSFWEYALCQVGGLQIDAYEPNPKTTWTWMPVIKESLSKISWEKYEALFLNWPSDDLDDVFNLDSFQGNWLVFVVACKKETEKEGAENEKQKQIISNIVPLPSSPHIQDRCWSVGTCKLYENVKEQWVSVDFILLPSVPSWNYFPILGIWKRKIVSGKK